MIQMQLGEMIGQRHVPAAVPPEKRAVPSAKSVVD